MANVPQTIFDEAAQLFADYGKTVRGYVRYELTHRNLRSFLTKQPMRILDVGGGNGPDAAWLAMLGHEVTLLEPSPEQRNQAERRFNFFLDDEERSHITMVAGNVSGLPKSVPPFDVVLIHGVAMYQPKPASFVRQAATRLKPGGILSLAEKGYYGAQARAIREHDYKNLRRLEATHRALSYVGHEVYAFKPEELEKLVHSAGAETIEWSGLRVISDDIDDLVSEMDKDFLAELLDVEFAQGHNPAIRGQGQMLHFIAKKL